jgi:hypothetical protein
MTVRSYTIRKRDEFGSNYRLVAYWTQTRPDGGWWCEVTCNGNLWGVDLDADQLYNMLRLCLTRPAQTVRRAWNALVPRGG